MDRDEVLEVIERSKKLSELRKISIGLNLHGADFLGADLSGLDLRGANLHGAVFEKAKLDKVDFSGANLHGADFSGRGTKKALEKKGVKFDGANLTDATFDEK